MPTVGPGKSPFCVLWLHNSRGALKKVTLSLRHSRSMRPDPFVDHETVVVAVGRLGWLQAAEPAEDSKVEHLPTRKRAEK